ncbi:MAG: hypothetical protein HEP71_23330 [Roseivirga sp.]|nr:hypothetical protein [Roseivirga sp.]
MRTSDGQSPCDCKCKASENQSPISEETIDSGDWTQPQIELLKLIYFHGPQEMAKSIRVIHDLALYQSEEPLDRLEKDSLYDLKSLAEALERVESS